MRPGAQLLEEPFVARAVRRGEVDLDAAVATVESRVAGMKGHGRRVSAYSALTARRMGIDGTEVARIRRAGLLHDIGKSEIPPEVLNWPGPLGAKDAALVRAHAVAGARMTAGLGDEGLTAIVRHHHERLDGSGYPYGLRGEQIPIGARIVAVADTFDALTSVRAYRKAMGRRQALRLVESEAGEKLDPEVVEAFRVGCSGLRGVLAATAGR